MDSQAPNPITKSPNHDSNLAVISMAIFVLVSLGIVIFFYYQNQALKSELVKYQTVTTPPTPVAVVVEKTASPSASPKSIKATPNSSPSGLPIGH
jgi:hypothetical protein